MLRQLTSWFVGLVVTFCSAAAIGENWVRWRGPHQNGVASGKGFPTQWSEEENIIWKVTIPGWGTSTPAIWDDLIFVTGEDNGQNVLICLGRSSGEKQWQVSLGGSAGNRNRKASGANPSPTTDGSHIYAYFRSGDFACVDLSGQVVWSTNLQQKHGPDRLNWDLGTSPVLVDDLVIAAVMHQAPSYLLALDKSNGAEVWRQSRETGAPSESRDSYTTPLIVSQDGVNTLVVLGADFVTGHHVATGEEIWRFGTLNPQQRGNFRSIASPVIVDDLVIAPYARGASLTAVRLGGEGDVSKSHQAWVRYDVAADVPSPTVHIGRVYLCRDRGDVVCIDSASGETLWSKRLPRNRYPYSSSPVIADGNLYLTREDGTTFVLSLKDEPELISTNVLRENTYATPVFLDGEVFLRTADYLFCIGQ